MFYLNYFMKSHIWSSIKQLSEDRDCSPHNLIKSHLTTLQIEETLLTFLLIKLTSLQAFTVNELLYVLSSRETENHTPL